MIPAIITFINVFQENRITTQVNGFIKNEIKSNKSLQLIDWDKDIVKKEIFLNFFNEITDATENDLTNELSNIVLYPNIVDFQLKIKGSDTKSFELITTAYKDKRAELQESKNIISGLQKQISGLQADISKLNNRIE